MTALTTVECAAIQNYNISTFWFPLRHNLQLDVHVSWIHDFDPCCKWNPCECEVSETWREEFSSRRMSHLGNQNTASSAAGSIRPYRCHTHLHMRWAYSDTFHFSKHTDNKESTTRKINVTKVCAVRSESQFDLSMCIGRWNSHLFTLSNTTQGPLHVTLTLWYEREGRGCGSIKEDLQWIDSDYRILSLSWVKRSSTKPCNPQTSAHQRSRGDLLPRLAFNPPWKKKLPLNVRPQPTQRNS